MQKDAFSRVAMTAVAAGAILLAGQSIGIPAGTAHAAELPAAVKALIAGAKKEGEVNIYGRTLKPSFVRAFTKRISAFYGFPIKLNMVGGLHSTKAAEVELAIKNRVPTGIDVFWTSYATAVRLERSGVLTKFDWSSIGIDSAFKASEYGVKSHDVSLAFITYNTNLVQAKDAPRAWDDLLDPKWKGRIAIPRSPGSWIYVTAALGEDKTTLLLKDLMTKQGAKILPRFPDVHARVVSGEFALGVGVDAFKLIRKGAPVKMAPMDPLALSNWAFYMMKDIRHPNVAKLWAYWIAATADGKKALDEVDGTGFVSTRGSEISKLAQGKKVAWLTREYVQKNGRRLAMKYGKIMGLRR